MGVRGVAAAVGAATVMLIAVSAATDAQTRTVDAVAERAATEIHNASMAAEDNVQQAEAFTNDTSWTAVDLALQVYGDVIEHWPEYILDPPAEVRGLGIAGRPIPMPPPPNLEELEPRPQRGDKAPAPPPEDEVRDEVESALGKQTHGTPPQANVTREPETPSDNETIANATTSPSKSTPPPEPSGNPEPAAQLAPEDPPEPLTTVVSEARPLPLAEIAAFAAVSLVLAVTAWLVAQARFVGRLFAGVPGAALFSRQSGAAVLGHPVRAQIHAAISQNAGITSVTLRQVTGFRQSVLRYHLGVLCREKLVRATRRGKIYHYHDVGRLDDHARARESLFWRGRNQLATAILQYPGASQQDVAKLAGLPASRVCDYTKELAEAGLVRSERVGRCRRYFPTSMLEGMVSSGQLPSAGSL